MNKVRQHIWLFLLLVASMAHSQWFPDVQRKGDIYGGWGWNRAAYTNSDIHFHGDDYDFTLADVHAKDRQTPFKAETYFGLTTVTIPQTNIKLGYFINDHLAITLGVDHMKYVMVQNQTVAFEGSIDDTTYMNMVSDNQVTLTPRFLTYEHTDGLNYLLSEIEYYTGIREGRFFDLNVYGGFGLGAIMPKSNVKLMGYPRNDAFHLAGCGTNVKAGVEFLFGNHFYVRGEAKAGYINMPSIVTRKASIDDRASQQFGFAAVNMMIGFNIPTSKQQRISNDNPIPSSN
jgi:hypothetical protein